MTLSDYEEWAVDPEEKYSCVNKKRHTSERNARLAILGMIKQGIHRGQLEYKCDHCGGWHIGRYGKNSK